MLVRVADACQAEVIDPARLARDGGHAIWLNSDGLEIESVRDGQGTRPWVPPLPPEADVDDQ